MSFLDNLENTLNALERQEQKDPEQLKRERERREEERMDALARAPYVEALRNSPFISELLGQCRAVGRRHRVLVQFTWIGDNLRLDAQAKRMELTPTAKGIVAVYSESGSETSRAEVDLEKDDPAALAQHWLGGRQ